MTISYVGGAVANGASVATTTVAWPTGTKKPHDGDVAIIGWTFQGGTVTYTAPAGWTIPTGGNQIWTTGNGQSVLMYRVCDGTESGNISLTNSTANKQTATLAIYRGVDTSNPIDAFTSANNGASTTHTAASVTLGVANAGVLTIVAERSSTGTSSWTAPASPFDNKRQESVGTGSGMTITALADDGMQQTRSAGTVVSPGTWTSANSFSGNAWIWTVSLTPRSDVAPYEIVTNGDFETDTTGWDSNSSWFTFADAVESQTTSEAFTGSGSMKVVYSGSTNTLVGVNWRSIDLDPSTTYYARAAIKVVSGRKIQMRTRDWNGGGTAVFASSSFVTAGTGWQLVTLSFTSGASADDSSNNLLSIVSESNAAVPDGEFYVDAVHFGNFVGDQWIAITGATETDASGTLTASKSGAVAAATETDAAAALTASKSGAVGAASETEAAGTLTASKAGALSSVNELDAAGALTGAKSGALVGVGETDSAAGVTASKSGAVGAASETEAAGTLTASKAGALSSVNELDAAGALTGAKSGALTAATETDAANELSPLIAGGISTATEQDQAHAVTGSKTGAISAATSTETAATLTASKSGTFGQGTETDAARMLSGNFPRPLTAVIETDAAATLTGSKTVTIGAVSETDSAGSLTASKLGVVLAVHELDTARGLTGQTTVAIGVVSETDSAHTLTPVRIVALVAATETDAARVLSNTSIRLLPPRILGAAYRLLFVSTPTRGLVAGSAESTFFVSNVQHSLTVAEAERRLFVGPPQ